MCHQHLALTKYLSMDAGLIANEAGRIEWGCAVHTGHILSLFGLNRCYRGVVFSYFPCHPSCSPALFVDIAMVQSMVTRNSLNPPQGLAAFLQKDWDGISSVVSDFSLLESADSEVSHAMLYLPP